MSPLHPPRGLSATAGALCSPKDAAVSPASQTSEPLALRAGRSPWRRVCCGFSSSFLEQTSPWAGGLGTRAAAPASASKFCARPKQRPFPASSSPSPPLCRGARGGRGAGTPYLPCSRVGNLLPSAVIGPAGSSKRLCSGMGRSSPSRSPALH